MIYYMYSISMILFRSTKPFYTHAIRLTNDQETTYVYVNNDVFVNTRKFGILKYFLSFQGILRRFWCVIGL